ncbi:MBL fold metallo-hydrolase [Streptomyces albicerus]|uniref:MBL fold metallo-hydrolase n=1 Tax=Streptomyces albicerus TaxID=2569859 RepID=UPI00124B9994|nr:MBL fold metallo-hydrolase [Streptomyces albicerus]
MTPLVDCGATSLVAMRQQGLDPAEVDTVVVSHLHGDHFGGIPFLILHCQFSGRVRPLTIVGPAGVRERVIAAMKVRDGPRRRRGPCQWSPAAVTSRSITWKGTPFARSRG